MESAWYQNAIIYGLEVDLYRDSNGDGIGDFRGAIEKLDYLADLGVNCVWLLPCFSTPNRDNGYDIINYMAIDPRLGNLLDFEEFIERARRKNIRVIIDLVVNHTSDQHPWFQAARRDAHSRYHSYYIWTREPPPTEQETIFPGPEDSVWTYDEMARAYYYHLFYHFQPDLCTNNPEVQEEIRKIMDFWLCFPISGFRIDAAPHLIGKKGLEETVPKDPHGILRDFYQYAAERNPEVVLLGEADTELDKLGDFFGDGQELQMLFNFLLSQHLFLAFSRENANGLKHLLNNLPRPPHGQWANFLRNLDELDMERLSKEEQEDVYRNFAPVDLMRIFNRGIRRRLTPMLRGEQQRLELAFSLLFSLPGNPTIMYGDEIGMGDNLSLVGRDAVRTPMQWSDEANAGFSDADREMVIVQPISNGQFDYRRINVAIQQGDELSLLSWMKRLIHTRKESPEIGVGEVKVLESGDESVLAHLCELDGRGILAVHNLAHNPRAVELDLDPIGNPHLEKLFGDCHIEWPDGKHQIRVDMNEYAYQWFRMYREES